jgi:phosphatidate cytidylyltransferase
MLRSRVLTALVLVGLLLAVVLRAPPAIAFAALALVFALAAGEWAAFAGLRSAAGRLGYVLLLGAVGAALHVWVDDYDRLAQVLGATLVWWCVALGWILLAPARCSRLAAAVAGALTLVPAWLATVWLYAGSPRGEWLVLFAIGLVGAADVGAFFAGRYFGRLPLAPRVSPKKTWEGVIGGFGVAFLYALAINAGWLGLAWWPFAALAAAAILLSVVGDLAESLFKRRSGLKDSGTLLPGHGGVLDRLDSLTAAVPLLALGFAWLGELR